MVSGNTKIFAIVAGIFAGFAAQNQADKSRP